MSLQFLQVQGFPGGDGCENGVGPWPTKFGGGGGGATEHRIYSVVVQCPTRIYGGDGSCNWN